VKLFVSALLLAAASAVFAQNQAAHTTAAQAQNAEQTQSALTFQINDLVAHKVEPMNQTSCPLYMESASVAPEGGYLPATAQNRQAAGLDLHFRNQSGKPIASASITAQLNVKTNVFALDAHPLQLRLTLSGTQDLDKTRDQTQHIVLPRHVYLFGVARVTLDQVTYADGSVWTAPVRSNFCRSVGGSVEHTAK
jgi:hypothetical protein